MLRMVKVKTTEQEPRNLTFYAHPGVTVEQIRDRAAMEFDPTFFTRLTPGERLHASRNRELVKQLSSDAVANLLNSLLSCDLGQDVL